MKLIASLLAAILLAGCAAIPGNDPPRYDHSQRALIAPGYPVERIFAPAGFELANTFRDQRSQAHDSPDDPGSGRVTELGVSWMKPHGDTANATATHQGAAQGSYWLPWEDSDGYEFVGRNRVQYEMATGPYRELAGDPTSLPNSAPECAASTYLLLHSQDRRKRTILNFTEGMACSEIASFGQRDAEALRQRAYQAFRLR